MEKKYSKEQAKFEKRKNFLSTDSKMQNLMKYVRAGLSQRDIAQLLNISQTTVRYYIGELKKYGFITQEEIDKARQEYKQEIKYDNIKREKVLEQLRQGRLKVDFAPELGLSVTGAAYIQKSLIEEGRITQEEIDEAVAIKGKNRQRKNKIIELLKQGYMYEEVSAIVDFSKEYIRRIKNEAVSQGEFTEEEYQNAIKERQARLKNEPQKPKEENRQLEQQVLELIKKGKNIYFISKKTGERRANIQAVIKKLIKAGKITQREIDESREKGAKELERKVLIGLRIGYSQKEILEMFEEGEYSIDVIQNRITKLKERGDITEEEINRYKYEAEQGEKKLQEFVLRGIKQGLSRAAIAELDETGYFTESKIRRAIDKMKKQGILTEKDMRKSIKNRKKSNQNKKEQQRRKKDKEIKRLLLQGFTNKEIAEMIGYSESYTYAIIDRMKKEWKITEDEIKNARKQRREMQKREQGKQEEERKEQQKTGDAKLVNAYKKKLETARKIVKASSDKYAYKQINGIVRELISLAERMQAKGMLKNEEIKIISEALFQAEKIDVNNVLGIGRLYLKNRNYQSSIYTLNYSKNFLTEDSDLQRVSKALETIKIYQRKMEAEQLLRKGYSLEVIQQRTKLSIGDLIEIKNKSLKSQQIDSGNKKSTGAQGDDEFPDL
jgi:DNA-binding NarL/FixJ family response regulator